MHILYENRRVYATWEQHSVFICFSFILSVLSSLRRSALFSLVLYVKSVCLPKYTHSGGSILSDGKLRVFSTQVKHRSTGAQAGIKPIINQMRFFCLKLGCENVLWYTSGSRTDILLPSNNEDGAL